MSLGDLIVDDYQYEYAGLLLGHGTAHTVTSLDGLYDMAEVRSTDQEKMGANGVYPGQDTTDGKKLTFNLKTSASTAATLEAHIRNLKAVFRVSQKEIPLVMQRPGWTDKRFINCRARRRNINTDYRWSKGYTESVVELFAADPRIYDLSQSASTGIQIDPGQSISENYNIDNVGDADSDPVLQIEGGVVNPTIVNGSKQIKLTCSIPNGTLLRIDIYNRNVQVSSDGGDTWVDHYEYVRADNTWWTLDPGDNLLQFSRQGTSGTSQLFVYWRAAYE